ncbi:MAG: hypothetical protein ACRC2H_00450 [Silanimonas sp.]
MCNDALRALPLALAIACGVAPGATAATDGPPQILADADVREANALPDFSFAGYGFGLATWHPPADATVILASAHGVDGGDDVDDSRALRAAFAAAHAVDGPVILRLPAGRLIVSAILGIERSEFTLEGAGPGEGGTVLAFPRPLRLVDRSNRLDALREYLRINDKRQVEPARNIDLPFSPYSWTGGFVWVAKPRGDAPEEPTTGLRDGRFGGFDVELVEGHRYRVGDIVSIEWFPRDGERSALLGSLYGEARRGVGKRHFEDPDRAVVVQTTRIEALDGRRARIADPLLHDIRDDLPARLRPWRGLREVAIRDMAFEFPPGEAFGHHLEEGWNAIHFGDVFNGWIDSLRIRDADSGILTYDSASLTIRDVRTEGERRAHYAVHLGSVHNALVTGIDVRNRVIHPLSFNTQSTRSVFHRSTVWRDAVLDQHAGANHQNLFDDVRLHVVATASADGPAYALWDGSGAAYWQPGHGRLNTHWNLRVHVDAGATADQPVLLTGLDEGPDARIVGLSGNRRFRIDYRPTPYIEGLNERAEAVPSLYEWQLSIRRQRVAESMRGSPR